MNCTLSVHSTTMPKDRQGRPYPKIEAKGSGVREIASSTCGSVADQKLNKQLVHTRLIPGHEGLQLCVDFAGDARGLPVIMLHGGGQTRHAWRGALLALALRGYYVAAMDLRGHGDSGWAPAADDTLQGQVADVVAGLP